MLPSHPFQSKDQVEQMPRVGHPLRPDGKPNRIVSGCPEFAPIVLPRSDFPQKVIDLILRISQIRTPSCKPSFPETFPGDD